MSTFVRFSFKNTARDDESSCKSAFAANDRDNYIKNLLTPLFFMGCFPRDLQEENGPLRHLGNGPLRRGNAPLTTLMGNFQAPRHGGKRFLQKAH